MLEALELESTDFPDHSPEVLLVEKLTFFIDHLDGWTNGLAIATSILVNLAAANPEVLDLIKEKIKSSSSMYATLSYMIIVGLVTKKSQAAE